MSTTRIDMPANPSRVKYAPAANTTTTALDEYTDSGLEQISLVTVQTYPRGISPVRKSQQASGARDLPYQAYDVRGCRSLSVQIDSYNVTTGATIQLLGSNTSLGYAPIYFLNPATGALVNSITIPTGGTSTAPNANLILINAPWFAWLQVSVSAADSTGQAYLAVVRRT